MRAFSYTIFAVVTMAALAFSYLQTRELEHTRSTLAIYEPGEIDVNFSQFMSLHHQQAIAMAQTLLDGRPTGLAPLASKIAAVQQLELGEMRGWLRLWDRGLLPKSDSMEWMLLGKRPLDAEMLQYLIDCRSSPTGMPGLATNEEMNRLRQLEGRARDELFLQMMLAHHEGGVPMARFAAREASLRVVRELAGRMVLEQSKEINQFRSMLAIIAGSPE